MNRLEIVIVAFEIFPIISARSFRTTELATELARKGHNVTLYTLTREYDYSDFIKETGVSVKNLGNINLDYKQTLLNKVLMKLAAFPLIKILPLIKKSVNNHGHFDYLISIAAPHPIHWGAALVKNKLFKCWTADCGDPYMKNPFGSHPFYFKWVEKYWCKKADHITVPISDAKEAYYKEFFNKIHVIPQGFDFSKVEISKYVPNVIPTFAYAGNCYKNGRDIGPFLEFLSTIKVNFKFIVYTKSQDFFRPYLSILGDKLILNDYLPRLDLIKELSKMDFLINVNNKYSTQSPSKLIDYSLTQRPILNVSTDFSEEKVLLEFLNFQFDNGLNIPDMSIYDIKNVADQFIELFKRKIVK